MATLNDRLTDKRIVERNIDKGLLTKEQLEKHLAALPDLAAQAEFIPLDSDADDDGYDDEDSED